MWAGHWTLRLRQFAEQPFHLVLLERHVDFDGRMARNGGGDASANLLQIQRLLFAGKLIEEFVQHVFNLARLKARWRNLYCDAACAEGFRVKAILLQLV